MTAQTTNAAQAAIGRLRRAADDALNGLGEYGPRDAAEAALTDFIEGDVPLLLNALEAAMAMREEVTQLVAQLDWDDADTRYERCQILQRFDAAMGPPLDGSGDE